MQKCYFLNYIVPSSQKAKKLDKFGGKMTKFEDIGIDLNKVRKNLKNIHYIYSKIVTFRVLVHWPGKLNLGVTGM